MDDVQGLLDTLKLAADRGDPVNLDSDHVRVLQGVLAGLYNEAGVTRGQAVLQRVAEQHQLRQRLSE